MLGKECYVNVVFCFAVKAALSSLTKLERQEQIDLLYEFTPRSQYACTKCIKYIRISSVVQFQIGSHICFVHDLKFYHVIVSEINKIDKNRVQLGIVHASRKSELSLVKKLFGKDFTQYDVTVQETLPEIDVSSCNVYMVKYGRHIYPNEKVLNRALSLVTRARGLIVPIGSLSDERIRPEATYRLSNQDATSEQFASWCATGECICLNSRKHKYPIEYSKTDDVISMMPTVVSNKHPVKCTTRLHQDHVLCDTCFLTEVVILANETNDPDTQYNLVTPDNTAWVNERKIPGGLYRVKYTPLTNEVIIKIKRYNSKIKRFALIVRTETFRFTLQAGRKCEVGTEIKYKFPYPFWRIPAVDELNF